MCAPLLIPVIVAAVASAASAALSHAEQSAQAKAQSRFVRDSAVERNKQFLHEGENARTAEAQEAESLARQGFIAGVESERNTATAKVSALESGVSGASVDSLLQEFAMQRGVFNESLIRQGQLNSIGTSERLESQRRGAAFSNFQQATPITRPSMLATGIRIATSASQAADKAGAFKGIGKGK